MPQYLNHFNRSIDVLSFCWVVALAQLQNASRYCHFGGIKQRQRSLRLTREQSLDKGSLPGGERCVRVVSGPRRFD